MRVKTQITAFFIVFLVMLTSANAFTNYTQRGRDNGYFNAGHSIFNSLYLDTLGNPDVYSQLLTNGRGVPLVSDLDHDGINELILIDGQYVKVYNSRNLQLKSSYNLGNTGILSNLIVHDCNEDNSDEILVARGINKDILILNYSDATGLLNKSSVSLVTSYTYTTGEMMIKCRDDSVSATQQHQCMAVISSKLIGGGGTSTLIAVPFNTTTLGTPKQITSSASHTFCFPRIKNIEYEDNTADGVKDFVFSYVDYSSAGGGNEQPYIISMNINSSFGATLKRTITPSSIGFDIADGGVADCSSANGAGQYISSPLVMNVNGGTDYETIFAEATSSSTYKMRVYSTSSSTAINEHPTGNADGQIISNPIKMNIFPTDKSGVSDKQNDYCIMGISKTSGFLELLCGSSINSYGLFDSIQYFSYFNNFNLTQTFDSNNIIAHSIDAETNIINSNNPDELLNGYGIWTISEDACDVSGCLLTACSIFNQCKMNLAFANGVFDSVLISVDYMKDGSEDWIAMTTGNIYYIDDKFQNDPPVICPTSADCSIQPCINAVWKENTTSNIVLKATDSDGDKVSYRAVSYVGDSNEIDSGWTANLSSGMSSSISFVANKTIGTGILRLYATDNYDPIGHIVQYPDISFSVSSTGVTTFECTSTLTGTSTPTTTTTPSTNTSLTPSSTNIITSTLGIFNSVFGIGLIAIWLLLMVALNVYMIVKAHEVFGGMDAKYMFAIISGIDLMLIILGGLLAIIPFWLILLLVIFCIGIFVVWIANKIGGG